MKKVKIDLDFSKILDGLVVTGEPKNIVTEVEMEETPENYKILCNSPLIKSWEFINTQENMNFSENNYFKIKEEFEDKDINIKDVRDIIMISYSYFCVYKMKEHVPKISEVIKYFLVNKERIKDKVYSEELILSTLSVLSETTNPLLDFLGRIDKTGIYSEWTFEEYYKKLYGTEK